MLTVKGLVGIELTAGNEPHTVAVPTAIFNVNHDDNRSGESGKH